MLKVQEIRELIKLVDQSSLDELIYEQSGSKLKLRKNQGAPKGQVVVPEAAVPTPQVVQEAPETVQVPSKSERAGDTSENAEESVKTSTLDDKNLHKIESPMVGTFYSAPSPEEADFVNVGDKVTNDSIVCIVEAMKLFNEIEAEVKGEIVEILVENGQLVEYGQPLFLVKPE